MRSLAAAVSVLAVSLAGVTTSVPASVASTVQATELTEPTVDDAIDGPALPERYREPGRSLLVGADDRFALYHSGHRPLGDDGQVYTLVSLADGAVVRSFVGPPACCFVPEVRLVDGSVDVWDQRAKTVVRHDAATGEVTGSVPVDALPLAMDDEWVLTETDVRWFDGRVVPLNGDPIRVEPYNVVQRGDSDLAVLSGQGGFDPVVVSPGTGEVVALERAETNDYVQVFAARSGAEPTVFGFGESGGTRGLVRWTDPASGAAPTVVPAPPVDVSYGGGLVGDRLLVADYASEIDSTALREVDPTTGAVLPATVVPDVWQGQGSRQFANAVGDVVAQADDGLVVSQEGTTAGSLAFLTADGVRSLGTPRPSPVEAVELVNDSGRVTADFRENRGASGDDREVETDRGVAVLEPGATAWTPVDGEVTPPTLPADPPASARVDCGDGTAPVVDDVRGRWQLERCGFRQAYVTDRTGFLPPHPLPGYARGAQLGVDHAVSIVFRSEPDRIRTALVVTDLDVRHRTRVYGPLSDDSAYSVDLTGDHDPVYADATGRVRSAPPTGLVDTTGPVTTVTRRPAAYVDAVGPTRLTFTGSARDVVDGSRVIVRVQTRRATPGSGQLGPWQAQSSSASGTFSVTARPGEQWCFRLAASDRSGNVGTSSPSCSVVPVDDRGLARSGTARRVSGDYLGGAATVLAGSGGAVTTSGLAGSRVVVWLRTGPGRGPLLVRDGTRVVQRVETYSRTAGLRAVVLDPVGRRLRLEAGSARAVVLDAVGQRRTG